MSGCWCSVVAQWRERRGEEGVETAPPPVNINTDTAAQSHSSPRTALYSSVIQHHHKQGKVKTNLLVSEVTEVSEDQRRSQQF